MGRGPRGVIRWTFYATRFPMPALSTLLLPDANARKILRTIALTGFAGILIAGSIPGARAEVGEYAPGVVLHSLAYAGLATLWFLASTGTPVQRALRALLTIALMGALDEGVQSFLPYRTGDVRDWMIDITAATFAATVLAMLTTLVPKPRGSRAAAARRR